MKYVSILIIALVLVALHSYEKENKSLKEELRLLREENNYLKAEMVGLKKETDELKAKLKEEREKIVSQGKDPGRGAAAKKAHEEQ